MEMDEVMQILRSFAKAELDYVLIGGVALNLHGIVRATEDLDLFVRPTAENVDRLRQALHDVYGDPKIAEIDAAELIGEYPAVCYLPPDSDLSIDILTRLGEFATFDDLEVVVKELDGVKVRLASPKTLYWLKKDTVRLQDRADASLLKEQFHLEDDEE